MTDIFVNIIIFLSPMYNNEKIIGVVNKKLSLIGFGTQTNNNTNEILKKECINQRDFIIKQIPELTSEGSERELFAEVNDLDIKKIKKGYVLKFKLKKRSYATEAIRQIFS